MYIKYTYLLLLFFLLSNSSFTQRFEFEKSIGKFKNSTSFFIAANGIIYITDKGNDQVISMDTSGNIIRTTGGYGWVESTFDEPVDVFATPLNVYVVDKNNHRIQRFDRDLNYISSLSKRDDNNDASRFGYPNSCTVSNQGDLYIIDTENQRVVKFDLFGNFIQNFGGYDSGNYQLRKPKSIAVSPYNRIYVLDETGVLIFDAFGNGVGRIDIEGKPASLRIIFEMLNINSKNKVYITNLRSEENLMREIEFTDVQIQEIVSSLSYLGKLYVLTKKEILIFSLTN